MKILFTTPVFGFPAKGGPELRIENSIKALAKIADLTIYVRVFQEQLSREANDFLNEHATSVRYLKQGVTKEEYWEELLKTELPDIIWFGYGNISYVLMKYVKSITQIPIVCDTDSVWSRFVLRELDVENDKKRRAEILNKAHQKELEEADWVEFCDITTAVSEIDAQYYRQLASQPDRIRLFSNVIDMSTYQKQVKNIKNIQFPSLYLAGTFWKNSPMEDASRWVVEDVLPIVMKKFPTIKLYLIGKNSKSIVGDLESSNIVVEDQVETVLPYLQYVDVVLVPLRFESGTRFKILEAMACKKAIVSTTLGAEGIPVIDNENILIADEANDFADKIMNLLDDDHLRAFLGERGYALVEKHYTIETLAKEGRLICKYLGALS